MGSISSDRGSPYEETNSFAETEQDQIEKAAMQRQINFLQSELHRVEKELSDRFEIAFDRIEKIEDEL